MIFSNLNKSIKIILPIFLGVFLVYYSSLQVSFKEILVYFKKADLVFVLLGVFLMLLSHLSRAYRWVLVLKEIGYNVSFFNSTMAIFSGYLVNYIFPRAGEFVRATSITNYEKVPFNKSMGSIISERIADVLMLFIVIVIALFHEYNNLIDFLLSKFDTTKVLTLFSIFSFVLIAGILSYKKLKNSSNKLVVFFKGFIDGVMSVVTMRNKKVFIFHTLVIWILYVLMFYVTIFSFNELEHLSFGAVLVAFIMASFSIVATNGGIGSYPLAIFAAFSLYGISKEPSIAFGWIVWGAQTLMIVVLGGLSFIIQPIVNRIK